MYKTLSGHGGPCCVYVHRCLQREHKPSGPGEVPVRSKCSVFGMLWGTSTGPRPGLGFGLRRVECGTIDDTKEFPEIKSPHADAWRQRARTRLPGSALQRPAERAGPGRRPRGLQPMACAFCGRRPLTPDGHHRAGVASLLGTSGARSALVPRPHLTLSFGSDGHGLSGWRLEKSSVPMDMGEPGWQG